MKRPSARADAGLHLLLSAAVFAVFMGYGSLLPVLAPFIEHLPDNGGRYDLSWHVGALTGVYTLALFAFAPVCGRLSDRVGQRPVLLTGLAGYVAALLLFGLSPTLWQAYAMRIASGIFASAVLPVAMAFAGASHPPELRARRFAWQSAAAGLGLLAGPALSGITTRTGSGPGEAGLWHLALAAPFAAAAALGAAVWLGLFLRLPRGAPPGEVPTAPAPTAMPATLFLLVLLVMFGLGSFEVAVALRGQRLLGLTPAAISIMFMECGLVMIVAQIAAFRGSSFRVSGRLPMVAGLAAMAGGTALLPYGDGYLAQVALVGVIGATSGILIPILSYRISCDAGDDQGAALGKSVAAGNLGQAAGSFAAGMLFEVRPEAPFWLAAGLLVSAALAATTVAPRGVNLKPNAGGGR